MSELPNKRSFLSRLGALGGGIAVGFCGRVVSGVLVKQLQQHRQDAERRDQILASLE